MMRLTARMANFCGRCLEDEGNIEFAARNDFVGIADEGQLRAGLCEGCGPHWFNHLGYPMCEVETESWYANPDQSFASCGVCKLSTGLAEKEPS